VMEGGVAIDADAPLERIPIYVRAGSIIPMGPEVMYAAEKPADRSELRIYDGADGDFLLYEDENDNYNYEKGAYATIAMHWDDGKKTLTLSDRHGTFPAMLQSRSFRIVFVRENLGAGLAASAQAGKVVEYSGKQIVVSAQ
jgi:alpha-D-xyloside xylohydrolase